MTQAQIDWLFIGDVTSVHGIKGSIKVRCGANNLSIFSKLKIILLKKNGIERQHKILALRIDRKFLIATLCDIEDRSAAESLVGSQFFGNKEETDSLPDDEWWIRDLIGLPVFRTNGDLIGTVSDIISSAQDLLEITPCDQSKKETILIPLVQELVPLIDIKARRIEIAELKGLLDDSD